MTVAEVALWGRAIGAVNWDEQPGLAHFQYMPEFLGSGIELAPLTMPLSRQIYSFPALAKETYHGLPGLLADSLPDDFGNALIDAWLASQGRSAASLNAVERLCYTGSRGMGALEYKPVRGSLRGTSEPLDVSALVELASQILTRRNRLQVSLNTDLREDSLLDILRVGTSAGGARAKAIIAWNEQTNEVRSGQVKAGPGFSYWILKFDGVSGNKDKELEDPKGYGLIEYAYSLMARDAGISMQPCRLLKENDRNHFMTQRFDRDDAGQKLHMQSLCAMEHFDFKQAGAYSYEQALQTIRKLSMPMAALEEQFRRMVFNIIARNQDDHVKNIAFLMDKSGSWSLSPAYDLTFSYNPQGDWTSRHQMSLNGKRDHFTRDDFVACANNASMKRGVAEDIIGQVQESVRKWPEFADLAGVPEMPAGQIAGFHRLDLFTR